MLQLNQDACRALEFGLGRPPEQGRRKSNDRRESPEFAELMRRIKTGGTHESERRPARAFELTRNEVSLLQRVVAKQSEEIAELTLVVTWARTRIDALEAIETLSALSAPLPAREPRLDTPR